MAEDRPIRIRARVVARLLGYPLLRVDGVVDLAPDDRARLSATAVERGARAIPTTGRELPSDRGSSLDPAPDRSDLGATLARAEQLLGQVIGSGHRPRRP